MARLCNHTICIVTPIYVWSLLFLCVQILTNPHSPIHSFIHPSIHSFSTVHRISGLIGLGGLGGGGMSARGAVTPGRSPQSSKPLNVVPVNVAGGGANAVGGGGGHEHRSTRMAGGGGGGGN